MKTNVFAMAAMATVALAMTACNNEENDNWNGEIRLTGSMEKMGARTVTADLQENQIAQGQTIGIFVSGGKEYNNVSAATTDENGTLGTFSTAMYYPTGNSAKINICAYHPFKEGLTDRTTAYDFSVAADQSTDEAYLGSDLLWAELKDVTRTSEAKQLVFSHKLAKIIIKTTPEDGASEQVDLKDATIKILGTETATGFTPSTGALSTPSSAATGDIIAASKIADSNTSSAAAILIPQTITAVKDSPVKFIEISWDSSTGKAPMYFKLEENATFAAGNVYTYNITAKLTGLVLGSVSVNGWTSDGKSHGGDAEMDFITPQP